MEPIRSRRRLTVRTTVAALTLAAAAAHAGGSADRDCAPDAVLADLDGEPLTREEKIARLDEALRESLARFDECQNAVSAAAGGRSVAGEGDGTETADSAHADGGVESVAARDVQGTEAPEDAPGTIAGAEGPTDRGATPADIPDDIPEPDNDSVLEAQIRRAAMEETDPKVRAGLWNEYRKYKGLPVRPVPDADGGHSDAQTAQ